MVLEVKNLNKHFIAHTRGGIEVSGFHNVSFTLKKGQFLSIAGKSGSGKSSILKVLYRSYLPSSGSINLYDNGVFIASITDSSDSEILSLRESHIGYVSQFLEVLPRVSAVNIVANPLVLQGESETKAKEKAKEMLGAFLGLKSRCLIYRRLLLAVGSSKGSISQKALSPLKSCFYLMSLPLHLIRTTDKKS